MSQYSDEHIISQTTYIMDFEGGEIAQYNILSYNNQDMTIIAENSSDTTDPAEHGKYSRFDWTYNSNTTLQLCQTTAFAASEEEAEDFQPANTQDLNNGCPGYGWLSLSSN